MTVKFGTDGWRAVIAETFTFENVRLVSQAVADYLIDTASSTEGLLYKLFDIDKKKPWGKELNFAELGDYLQNVYAVHEETRSKNYSDWCFVQLEGLKKHALSRTSNLFITKINEGKGGSWPKMRVYDLTECDIIIGLVYFYFLSKNVDILELVNTHFKTIDNIIKRKG